MRKPNVIQVTAGLTIMMSVGANVWYGVDHMDRGGIQLIVVGVWMPVILALLERVLHASRAGRFFKFMLGLVAVCAMAYSMSHLAHLATPEGANLWEHISAWLFAITVDVAMVLAGWALMNNLTPAPVEPQVVERVVEVPVEVEKIVYVERPALHVESTVEETETITETREVTRTRRSALTAEQHERVIELIDLKREEIASGVKGVAAEIMRKVELSGHTNVVTRLPEWKAIKG
jgi:hypothetical protein